MKARTERAGLYSTKNPPNSVEEAETRLEELELVTGRIEVQLENTYFDEFDSEEEFRIWKNKAMTALALFRQELRFLKGFVNASTNGNPRPKLGKKVLAEINHLVGEKARELVGEYRREYSEEKPPETVEEASGRKNDLYHLVKATEAFFAELRSKAKGANIGDSTLAKARRPASLIAREMNGELRFLNDFIKENEGERFNHTGFLFGLVERAIQEGFTVSEEEQGLLEDIRIKREAQERVYEAAERGE